MRMYERLDKISENREPQRAYYIPYDSLEYEIAGSGKYWGGCTCGCTDCGNPYEKKEEREEIKEV